jgi:hypothetical protein
MWDLNDNRFYIPIASVQLPFAITYGSKDRDKRERIREAVQDHLTGHPTGEVQWAFRVFVRKGGTRDFDLDNVPKLIVDSFCSSQIIRDKSLFQAAALYPSDTIDHVVGVQVAGERVIGPDSMLIQIFARLNWATCVTTRPLL